MGPTGRSREAGFTLLEIQIVVAVIAIVAAIAVPRLAAGRLAANETAVIANLRTLVAAQSQFHMLGRADADADGAGAYGGFAELTGQLPGRMAGVLVPPVLSGAFRQIDENGEVARSGYFYRVFLPGPGGVGVGEPQAGFANDGTLAEDLAETTWCCYAWPVNFNQSGTRTFFVNQGGDVISTTDSRYSGAGRGPPADAALTDPGVITGAPAIGAIGQDGNVWMKAN